MITDELFKKGLKYEILIGLKDKDSYKEVFNVNHFINILVEICKEKQICFSLITQLGGYTHKKGYTTETSMRLIVIGVDENEIIQLGDRLKKEINTDTILITKTDIEYSFI